MKVIIVVVTVAVVLLIVPPVRTKLAWRQIRRLGLVVERREMYHGRGYEWIVRDPYTRRAYTIISRDNADYQYEVRWGLGDKDFPHPVGPGTFFKQSKAVRAVGHIVRYEHWPQTANR